MITILVFLGLTLISAYVSGMLAVRDVRQRERKMVKRVVPVAIVITCVFLMMLGVTFWFTWRQPRPANVSLGVSWVMLLISMASAFCVSGLVGAIAYQSIYYIFDPGPKDPPIGFETVADPSASAEETGNPYQPPQ